MKKALTAVGIFITAVTASSAVTVSSVASAAVLAKIGQKEITDVDVRTEFEGVSKDQQKSINNDPNTLKYVVDNVINTELVVQEGMKAGIEKETDYKKALERFKKQFISSKMMEKSIESKLTNSEIKKFYEKNKSLFDDTQVCASHVVVEAESDAKGVLSSATAKGAKFDEIAKKKSLDPTAQDNGGDLGCFTRDKMVPEFTTVAFKMRKGEIKGPFQTMYGWHVIKVYDVKPGKVPGFAEVEQRAKDAYRVRLLQEYVSELRAKSKIQLFDEAIKGFRL